MKNLLLALLVVIIPSAAVAHPDTISHKFEVCAFYAAKGSEYAALANGFKTLEDFQKFVELDIAATAGNDSVERDHLLYIAHLAWDNRAGEPTDVAMQVYEMCTDNLGTST